LIPVCRVLKGTPRCYFFFAAFLAGAFFAAFLAAFLVAFFIDLFSVTSDFAIAPRPHCDLFINLVFYRSQEKSALRLAQAIFHNRP
jgi:hypothetical protein